MKFIKKSLKAALIQRQHRVYEKIVRDKTLSYDQWIRQQEEKVGIVPDITNDNKKILTNDSRETSFGGFKMENEGNYSSKTNRVEHGKKKAVSINALHFLEGDWGAVLKNEDIDILILTLYEGELSEFAAELIYRTFSQNDSIILIYGDEDVQKQAQGERIEPWFKPDWSPDRFLSSYYFGGLIAVKREALRAIWEENNTSVMEKKLLQDDRQTLYELLYKLIRVHGGFSGRKENGAAPVYHIRQVLFHSRESGYEQIKELRLPETMQCVQPPQIGMLISVIIPSKDNPEVLLHCIHSLIERTHTAYPYEIVIVDNGSDASNRQRIEEEIERLKSTNPTVDGFTYVYQPMKFNFSDMCNLGAGKAKGNFLLFLNDDMEIFQADWLDLMVEKAALPYAGAVGAKLLYPNSDIIQHAGITNLRVGPAHKLQFLGDDKVHYYGMNRGVHNMLAVTGACLLLRREVFDRAGGFCRELAVAFNDVDLCYTLYEKGYYNIVRNDVMLYHHESLSRGKDGESEEKQLRLLKEKDLLYARHQALYGKDPFYHPYLTTDMLEADYSPACRYQVTLDMPWSETTILRKLPSGTREDSCLVVGMECAMDIYKWKYGVEAPEKSSGGKSEEQSGEKGAGGEEIERGDRGYYFQGYTFVIGADNACYSKKLLLKNQKNGVIFQISVDERHRNDIKNNLCDQLNVDLTGFASKVKMNALPEGSYQFGMLAKDRCSRLKLVNWSNWTLEVKK